MSQYLSFILRKKDNPDIHVYIGYFYTTPARVIPDTGAFDYTTEETLVTEEMFNTAISGLQEHITKAEKGIMDNNKRKEKIIDIITKCSSKEALDALFSKMGDYDSSNADYEETIENYTYYKNKLELIKETAEDNKDWELYYSNC